MIRYMPIDRGRYPSVRPSLPSLLFLVLGLLVRAFRVRGERENAKKIDRRREECSAVCCAVYLLCARRVLCVVPFVSCACAYAVKAERVRLWAASGERDQGKNSGQ